MKFLRFALLCAATVATSATAAATNDHLTIGTTQEFETLHPLLGTTSASSYVALMVNRPLVIIDPDWNFVCELCDRMPSFDNGLVRALDDKGKKKLAVDWQLKKGLTWSDGTPLTAQDFKLAWEIGRSPNVSIGGLVSKDGFERIEAFSINPQDPLKFTVTFNEPRYDFYQLSMFPMPSRLEGPIWEKTKGQPGAYEKQSLYVTDPTHSGLANGPYVVTEVKAGNFVALKRNTHFAGKAAHIETITLKLVPDTKSLEAMLLAGTIDVINELGLTFDQAVEFDKKINKDQTLHSQFKVLFRDGLVYEHVDLNLRNAALADKNVRKALLYALDRKKLSQVLFAGKQQPAIESFHPIDPYFTKDVVLYDYDPAKAAELLEAAGWKLSPDNHRYNKDGKKLELTIMTTRGVKVRELVEQFMQSEYKKAGIALNIKNEQARDFFGETIRKGLYSGLAMFAWASSPDNPPRTTLHSKEIPTPDNGWNGQNSGGFRNKRADELLEQVVSEFNLSKRKALMAELMRIYTDEVPSLPLYLRAEIAVVPTRLNGFRITGHQFYSTVQCEDWDVAPAVPTTP